MVLLPRGFPSDVITFPLYWTRMRAPHPTCPPPPPRPKSLPFYGPLALWWRRVLPSYSVRTGDAGAKGARGRGKRRVLPYNFDYMFLLGVTLTTTKFPTIYHNCWENFLLSYSLFHSLFHSITSEIPLLHHLLFRKMKFIHYSLRNAICQGCGLFPNL